MKKYQILFLGAAALLATACSEEPFTSEETTNQPVTLRATIEGSISRAAIEGGKVKWQAKDKFSVRLSDDSNLTMTVASGDGTTEATFTGVIVGEKKLNVPTVAVYPAGNHNLADGSISINMPDAYTVADNTNTNMPMICHFNNEGVGTFSHLGGVVQLTLNNVPADVTQFRFTSRYGKNITGNFSVADDAIAAADGDGSQSSVTISFDRAQMVGNNLTISVPVPVGTYEGMDIEFLKNDGSVASIYSSDASTTVGRRECVEMSDLTATEIPDAGYTQEGDNYTIYNATGLTWLAGEVNNNSNTFEGKTIKLASNIDLTGIEWTPIGNGSRSGSGVSGKSFKGTFDGQGHKVSGLSITTTPGEDAAIGLFGAVDGGTVKNIVFNNANINVPASEMAAVAVGMLTGGGTVSGIKVSNSTVTALRGHAAIVGRMTISGTISDCTSSATINGTGANVGGIVGAAYYSKTDNTMTISNCTNTGTINSTSSCAGGICGFGCATISNCKNTGAITGSGTCVGGIVGEQQNGGAVTYCENTANIVNNGSGFGTGGIVGWIRYSGTESAYEIKEKIVVSDCINHGNITGGSSAGGIVGHIYHLGSVTNCKNYASTITASDFEAGVVGTEQTSDTYHPGIDDSKFSITVTNNVSTTTIPASANGVCRAPYIYINDYKSSGVYADFIHVSGNTGAE